MSRLVAVIRHLLVLAAVGAGPGISAARAAMAAPEPIDEPLAEEWRLPVSQFLWNLGIKDTERALAATRSRSLAGVASGAVVLRIEARGACVRAYCMTVIGTIDSEAFHPEAQFLAGRMMTIGDVWKDAFGNFGTPPVYFLPDDDFSNEASIVRAWRTRDGWIILPPIP